MSDFYRTIYDDSPLLYIIIDKNKKIIDVNKAFLDLTGYDDKNELDTINKIYNKDKLICKDNNEISVKLIYENDNIYCLDVIDNNKEIINSISSILSFYASENYDIFQQRQLMIDEAVKLSNSDYGYMCVTVINDNKIIGVRLTMLSTDIYKEVNDNFKNKYPIDTESLQNYIFYDMEAVYCKVLHTKKPYYTNKTENHKHFNGKHCPFQPNNSFIENYLSYPMIHGDRVIGSIGLTGKKDYNDCIVNTLTPLINAITNIEIANITSKKLYDEQEKRVKLAESVSKTKSNFVANMSHEIRTPMNGIIGMLTLLNDTELDTTQKEYSDICMNSAESLMAVLNDILLFSKAEADSITLEHIPFNLNDLVEDIMCLIISNVASNKDIEIVNLIDSDVPLFLIGDPTRLRQILNNLIGNAIKFTSKGDIIIYVSVEKNNPLFLKFEISDTGIGISKQQIDKLFQPFSQVDVSTNRQYGGTGLGLVICKMLVNIYEGDIWVDSRVGRGSTFSFTAKFEINYNQDTIPYGPKNTEIAKLKGIHVLIIDDNSTNCLSLEMFLKNIGCTVTYCHSGVDGINVIKMSEMKNNKFDIILLDYHMPHMDGIEVARILHRMEINIKIIMLSSSLDHKKINEEPNIHACSLKPIRKKHLLHMIYNTLLIPDLNIPTKKQIVFNNKQTNHCILVVEDNNVNRKVITTILKKSGFKTEEATNGIEAVDKVKNNQNYYAILLDIHMPLMDGIETAQLIKDYNIPIVVLTADITEETKKKCKDIGIKHYVTKPVNVNGIISVINSLHHDKKTNILIVDDMVNNQIVLKHMLLKINNDLNILIANDGKEVLDMYNENIDLIFMDINMPIIDGNEATLKIKEINKKQIIIGVTAHDDSSKISDAFDDIVNKPIKIDDLKKIFSKFMEDDIIVSDKSVIFDETVIFDTFSNDIEIAKTIVLTWQNDMKELIGRLDKDIINVAHTIKGASYQVGAVSVGDLAKELEKAILEKDNEKIESIKEKMIKSYENTIKYVSSKYGI